MIETNILVGVKIRKLFLYVLTFLVIILVLPIKETQSMYTVQQQLKSKVVDWTSSKSINEDAVPSKQEFAVNNIQMNMTKGAVEEKLGSPQRVTSNEYGTNWHTYYSDHYRAFVMVSYIDDKVNALYSNQNVISSKSKLNMAHLKRR